MEFPACFDELRGNDVQFEMVASNSLQSVRLAYSHNVVTQSVAIIFVNTYTGGLLDDQLIIGDIPWSKLRLKIIDDTFDDNAFYA